MGDGQYKNIAVNALI